MTITPDNLTGVWSAAPTPFDANREVDVASIERLTEHQLRLGISGLFLNGTCGEGPWMPNRQRSTVVQATVAAAKGRLPIAVQVTDNSAARILDNIETARQDGVGLAVIAPPHFLRNPLPENILKLYHEAIAASPLPVIVYDLGKFTPLLIPSEILFEIYTADNVVGIKDSSSDPERRDIALAARAARPDLRLLCGDEFNGVEYIAAGYDGLMLGGAAFQGRLANEILHAVRNGDLDAARELQARMNRLMFAVYGEKIECWLAGLKTLLIKLGIFSTTENYLNYTLSESCERAINDILEKERDVLLP